jgi:hypothetical protein
MSPAIDPNAQAPSGAAPARKKAHRVLVPLLLVLATIVGVAGAFAVWVNRQALSTSNWSSTSGKILEDKQVRPRSRTAARSRFQDPPATLPPRADGPEGPPSPQSSTRPGTTSKGAVGVSSNPASGLLILHEVVAQRILSGTFNTILVEWPGGSLTPRLSQIPA